MGRLKKAENVFQVVEPSKEIEIVAPDSTHRISTMSWKATTSFVDKASQDVMSLVEQWKQRYGADDVSCGLILEAMSKSLLEFADTPDPTATAHGYPNHDGRHYD